MHAGLLEGHPQDYDLSEAVQHPPVHYPTSTSEAAAYFLRSLMVDAMPDNRQPIPPFEDYPPDPIFCFLKTFAEQAHQPASAIPSFWSGPNYEALVQREQPASMQPSTQEAIKVEPMQQTQLKLEEVPSPTESRTLGGLTRAQRKEKIARYLEKRRRRSFAKKVAYDCRKKVADQRIRVKGRFVTRKQALELLSLPEGQYAEELIKRLLLERLSSKKSIDHDN